MHWNRTVARIFLLFSVANFALAAPAVRKRHLEMAEAVLEKRALSNSDEPPELGPYQWLDDPPPDLPPTPPAPAPLFREGDPQYLYFPHTSPSWWKVVTEDTASIHDSAPSEISTDYDSAHESLSAAPNYDSDHESMSASSGYKTAPESSTGSFTHSGSVGSMPELLSDYEESVNSAESASGSEGSASEWYGSSQHDSASESGSSQHDTASESGSSQHDPASEPGSPQHDSASESSADSAESMMHLGSVGSIPELVSDSEEPANSPEQVSHSSPYHLAPEDQGDQSHYLTPPELSSGSNQYLTTPGSGSTPSTHGDSLPVSVNPSRPGDTAPDMLAASTHDSSLALVSANPSTFAPGPGAPPLHNDLPPESGTSQFHGDLLPQGDQFFDDALRALFRRGPLGGKRTVVDQSRSLLGRL